LVSEEKDLGVLVTNALKWNKQCNAAASKAMKALGMIKRTFNYLNMELFLVLYGTYVRLHLEYCIQVWAQYNRKDIHLLEKVQQRATWLVKCISKLN
jgi:ribonucleases P/MRP protein subunit RPP40